MISHEWRLARDVVTDKWRRMSDSISTKVSSIFERLQNLEARGALSLTLLQLLLCFSLWKESDLYRYAALLLLLFGIVYFYTVAEFKAWIGWLAFACYGWALFVGIRYVYYVASVPDNLGGASEGIYLLTALYPTIGYSFFINRENADNTIRLFSFVSLFALFLSLLIGYSGGSWHPNIGLHSNRIHAAVATGPILLASIARIFWLAEQDRWSNLIDRIELAVCTATALLAAVLIVGWLSKSSWFALAVVLPVSALAYAVHFKSRRALAAVSVVALGLVVLVAANFAMIEKRAAPVASAVWTMLSTSLASEKPLEALHALIETGTLAPTLQSRLLMWWNAIEIWSTNPLFGVGPAWEDMWRTTEFQNAKFADNMHNGYLETGIRHGLFGIGFYVMLYGVLGKRIISAFRNGLIPFAAVNLWFSVLGFFAITLLSNSNERLPQGESLLLILAAVGFWMQYEVQYAHQRGTRGTQARNTMKR